MEIGAAFILGVGGSLVGAGMMAANLKNLRRRRRIIDTPTSKITEAPGNAPVEIKGTAVPAQATITAPFTGRPAVWLRVKLEEHVQSGKSSTWRQIHTETHQVPFFIDDGSGERARVMPESATVLLDDQKVATSGTFNDAAPQLEAFLQSRGMKSTNFLGFNRSLRYSEALLAPHDPIYAIGPSTRGGGGAQGPFREGPRGELVMAAQGTGAGELIITNKTEAQIVASMLWPFVVGCILLGLGVIGLLVALIA